LDHRRPFAALLTQISLILFACLAATASNKLNLREARWTVADPARLYKHVMFEPNDCSAPAPADQASADIGAVAFRNPLLLGGQAARLGLSCNTCHRSGRGNPDFAFPGLSGDPGTADVTSSLMSRMRDDGKLNPVPIPDLSGLPETHKVSRTEPGRLESFIRGLIVEEFDGAEPPPAVLAGLATYVRSLGGPPEAPGCAVVIANAIQAGGVLKLYQRAVRAAQGALEHHDVPTALVMLSGARTTLGMIDERYAQPGLERARAVLGVEDTIIAADMAALRRGQAVNLAPLMRRIPALAALLERGKALSLYNGALVARTLNTKVAFRLEE
jgi:mono/diheme cytochrome c family protein